MMLRWLLFVGLFISDVISEESWVVNTEYGDVRGYWSEEHQVWEFLGIPYAAAPVGDLRFKAPVPPEPWTEVFNATEIKTVCMQSSIYTEVPVSEDCLVINVYVPESAQNGNPLPVLYFAHGGAFVFGSSSGYNPYHTTRHDVILVTFNYRLGAFGYLCLGTELIPGNAGVKDHIATLRWTNKNIAYFGGDPDAVTIYGESSGAANVEALVVTPVTNGLFHRAIIESGSILLDWSTSRNRLGIAKAMALNLGCNNIDDLERLGECLREASTDDLIRVSQLFSHCICIENELKNIESAITIDPFETLQSADYEIVEILYAHAELESAGSGSTFLEQIPKLNDQYDDSFIPTNIELSPEQVFEANNNFNKLYFNGNPVTNESLFEFLEFSSDILFLYGFYKSAILNARNGNTVYVLTYAYHSGFNQYNYYAQMFNTSAHADVVANIMDLGHINDETIAQDQIIRDKMTEIWTNFVKYGNPIPENSSLGVSWPPFTVENQYRMKVTNELSVNILETQERMAYWAELYENYYYPPPVFGAGIRPNLSLFMFYLVYANILF